MYYNKKYWSDSLYQYYKVKSINAVNGIEFEGAGFVYGDILHLSSKLDSSEIILKSNKNELMAKNHIMYLKFKQGMLVESQKI